MDKLFEFGSQIKQYEAYQARRRQDFLDRMEEKLELKERLARYRRPVN